MTLPVLITVSPWLYWVSFLAYAVTVLSLVAVIVSENRNPLKSLAWITVLITFPVGGLILYIFFGRSIKNTRMISRRKRRRLLQSESREEPSDYSDSLKSLSPVSRQQIELARSLAAAPVYTDNRVEIFADGKEKFARLKEDLMKARHTILLQYYIFESDKIGSEIADILIAKAKEGVKVRVIYDHIGSIKVRNRFFKTMREAGVEIYPFFRVVFPIFATRINWRNHRKICVIDGRIGYIGGMNIADRYLDGGKFESWHDLHLRVTGPAVAAFHYSFAVDWNFMGNQLIEPMPSASPVGESGLKGAMQLVTAGPTGEWSNIGMVMLKAIGNAKKRVWIQTPYFLPTEGLLRALQAAALARVDVRVMMPARSDSAILTHASYSYIKECLRAGIKIYLFEGGMLHSKMMVVDDDFATVGSTNFDFRSFEHNFESNLFIYSTQVNEALRRRFMIDQADSRRLNAAEWRRRPLSQRILESIVRLLSPIL